MQLLTYVQTRRITAWKNMVLKSGHPSMVYGSRDSLQFPHLGKGDVLWIISSTPGRSPSLTAKLVVESVGDENCERTRMNRNALMLLEDPGKRFQWVAIGGQSSCFYGFNDAGPALLDLTFLTGRGRPLEFGKTSSRWEARFAHYLQRPIRIEDQPGENSLEKLAKHCEKSTIFISWKHSDHIRHRFPLELAYSLVERGFAVWFDLLALPPSKYLGAIQRDPVVLTRLLQYGYEQSRYLLAIDSERYGRQTAVSDKNWTLDEWSGALDRKKARIRFCVPVPKDKESPFTASADHIIRGFDPECIAIEVSESAAGNCV